MKFLTPSLLKGLQLSADEGAVYLAALELGQASILDLARKSKVKRTTIYHLIGGLKERGLLQETRKKKRAVYSALHPDQLVVLEQTRVEELKSLVPELSAIANASRTKPRVTFYEGTEGIKEALTNVLRVGESMVGWADFSFRQSVLKDFFDVFSPARAKRDIGYKAIVRDSAEAREWERKNVGHLRDFKYIQSEPFNTETVVYGNCVMFLSYQTNAFAVVIEDANVAATLRVAWKQLWERLKK